MHTAHTSWSLEKVLKLLPFVLFVSILVPVSTAEAAWDKGFNFRATNTYVSDGANETYSLGEAYPTTRNSVTFGWNTSVTSYARNRNSANDRRTAGIVFSGDGINTFRVDLPATGDYNVTVALGDAGNSSPVYANIKDNTTSRLVLHSACTAIDTDHYIDASDTERTSSANWVTNGSTVTATLNFTTTTFFIQIGNNCPGTNAVIAHLFISQVASAPASPARTIRLFEGFRIKLISGRMVLM